MDRLRVLLPALWAGLLLTIAFVAAPSAFAALGRTEAGQVVARLFAIEANVSLACGLVALLLERTSQHRARPGRVRLDAGLVLPLVALFCTVAGYFALQPMLDEARLGRGALSFAQLHAVSLGFYALKLSVVLAMAWRAAALRPGSAS